MVADFAARVAKAATESSDSGSPVPAVTAPETTFVSQITTPSLSNIQTNSNDINNQCNNNNGLATPTQNISKVHALCSQSLDTSNNVTQIEIIPTPSTPCPALSAAPSSVSSSTPLATVSSSASISSPSSCAIKSAVESKPLQLLAKEFHPRGEKKTVSSSEETVAVVNVDAIPTQPVTTLATATPVVEQETKSTTSPSSVNVQTPSAPPQHHQHHHHHQQQQHHHHHQQQLPPPTHQPQQQHSALNVTVPEVSKSSSTPPSVNPTLVREPFSSKTSSNSPPRRKSQSHHGQSTNNPINEQLSSNTREQKDKKREKSVSSRGATPAPAHNQPDHHHHHHQKTNGDASGDKTEQEPNVVARNELLQHKQNDGEFLFLT